MTYRKSIEVFHTGMVVAMVHQDGTDRCVGIESFTSMSGSNSKVKRLCEKAHAWADQRIRLCEEYERPKIGEGA